MREDPHCEGGRGQVQKLTGGGCPPGGVDHPQAPGAKGLVPVESGLVFRAGDCMAFVGALWGAPSLQRWDPAPSLGGTLKGCVWGVGGRHREDGGLMQGEEKW